MARQNTRDLLIGVAAELFATRGLRKTTMEAIAATAGRGRRTVYMYFRNKAGIYNAVVESEIKKITRPLREILAVNGDNPAILEKYVSTRTLLINDILKRNPLLTRDFAMEHGRVEKLRERLGKEEQKMLSTFFRRWFEGSQEGLEGEHETCAVIICNLLKGNDRLLTAHDGLEKADDINGKALRIFLEGLVAINKKPV